MNRKWHLWGSCCLALLLITGCGASGASDTNNQTAGVEEGDIVKVTDDGYIYKKQSDGFTVSLADDGAIIPVYQKGLSGYRPQEMILTDDYLVLIANGDSYYGGTISTVQIYSVAALKSGSLAPLVRQTQFYGYFYTARLFQNHLYVFLQVRYNDYGDKMIDSVMDSVTFPAYQTLAYTTQYNSLRSGFVIARFDFAAIKTNEIQAVYYQGKAISDIYHSPYAIYAITYKPRSFYLGCGPQLDRSRSGTYVARISLTSLTIQHQIPFPGTILDRYSLYDNGKAFFIAGVINNGSVVNAYDQEGTLIGSTPYFAPGEQIKSVRFDGEIAYVVTFRTVDPLFKIDISNPKKPTILGELKIDGYSTQLQPFGQYLIGLGHDTYPNGGSRGVKVTLFNVNGDSPQEINSLIFLDAGSVALAEPRAILNEADNNLFAFPIFNRVDDAVHGAMVLGVSQGQLVQRSFITHVVDEEPPEIITPIERNPQENRVERIIRIGEYLYTIMDQFIGSYNLADCTYNALYPTFIN